MDGSANFASQPGECNACELAPEERRGDRTVLQRVANNFLIENETPDCPDMATPEALTYRERALSIDRDV